MWFYRIDLTWWFAACMFSLGEVWRVCAPLSLHIHTHIYISASTFILELVLNHRVYVTWGSFQLLHALKKKEIILRFYRPVMLRTFDSGVMVIQSKSHSDVEVKHLYWLHCLRISFLPIQFLLFWVFPNLSYTSYIAFLELTVSVCCSPWYCPPPLYRVKQVLVIISVINYSLE